MKLNPRHPRFRSLSIRDRLVNGVGKGVVVAQGLIAHGRGEAFDYMLGEQTTAAATRATVAATAFLLRADRPVLSVNGNTAALAGKEVVKLASIIDAPIEINLFHRTPRRERAIAHHLQHLGARNMLGIGKNASWSLPRVSSSRKRVDPEGIMRADVVLVPLEDGDRAEALRRAGKTVIAIDLNPLSRTSQAATVSIVDNVVRAMPALVKASIKMRDFSGGRLGQLTTAFDNQSNLASVISEMLYYLRGWMGN